ncbi:MAG: 1,4-alpha-glucan-branching enzyme [Deltaproteobacteria bacterium CG1_02_45_11]|nr:MAG: 1,4-alpha-glucan-branching enzyme [Deltaproteobacteria bacterium CG1_02_45_11]
MIRDKLQRLLKTDPFLEPYEHILQKRLKKIEATEKWLTQGKISLSDFASGHEYFGLHFRNNEWVFREWAPNANSVYFIGDITEWKEKSSFALERTSPEGVWEIRIPPTQLFHGCLYRLRVYWPDGAGDRIPAYVRRVVQDPHTLIFNAQVWLPPDHYQWEHTDCRCSTEPPLIYETHVGMAQEEEKVGTYKEFTERILPRIVSAGYNTLQLMAIQEHPYYASFGYHVSNLFSASSRFGTPEDLKQLIDIAHGYGLRVIMDLVHSHAVSNETEGLSRFDGTPYQFFHEGKRGIHNAWDSRCFDYAKYQVLHFLLSNCRFWLDEYRIDGFRFDGVTSMLYLHHGLEKAFTSYDDYFNDSVDEDALTYMALANKVIHTVRPEAITIAEDVSGMPGLAVPISEGGIGFDYRLAMGIPDFWIRLAKEVRDEDWSMPNLWYELTNRRKKEKTISYAESHDQALVGDQTLIFRLMGSAMYDHMSINDDNITVDRGLSLIKLIRLVTLATAGNGYLNFMGNEFGHPEWIDFPRQGNAWSYRYARRQWHLADDSSLKYHMLGQFDRDILNVLKIFKILEVSEPSLLYEHTDDKVIAFKRTGLLFVFNFHPTCSYADYRFEAPPGKYRILIDSDATIYGGHGRLDSKQFHFTLMDELENRRGHLLSLYLPTRTGIVLQST